MTQHEQLDPLIVMILSPVVTSRSLGEIRMKLISDICFSALILLPLSPMIIPQEADGMSSRTTNGIGAGSSGTSPSAFAMLVEEDMLS